MEGAKTDLKTAFAVSKNWNHAAWELLSEEVSDSRRFEVVAMPLATAKLAMLKKRIASLDLSSVHATFIKELKSKWSEEFCSESFLSMIEVHTICLIVCYMRWTRAESFLE